MIAGPELLTAIVEPYEFLDFVSGKLSRQFVQGEEDLRQRLTTLDNRADPDGLYHVDEFFLPRRHLADDNAPAGTGEQAC
ncbi:MAG: hypothetical protein GWP61_24515 [Chloroflexi bacterium]|jgi:hypothetical protein|nr:hypothetical protein [Chloroflexota bacterium]